MLNDRKYKQIVNEWFARLEKGYAQPPYTKHELKVLDTVLKRNNIYKSAYLLEAGGINQTIDTVDSSEYAELVKKIDAAADKYARYLTVFHYFAPDALGTISEILLSKLLGGTHTGGSQGLTDLKVGNINISLKTTAADAPILLGSKNNTAMSELELEKAKEYYERYRSSPVTIGKMIDDIMASDADENTKTAFKRIEFRINAIAEKMSGDNNDEYFLWASKSYSRGILTMITLYFNKFDKNKVLNDLKNGYLHIAKEGAGKSWGIKDASGKVIVGADVKGKYLNIQPDYIRSNVTNKKEIPLLDFNIRDLETGEEKLSDRAKTLVNRLQSKASDEFFKYLDKMYDSIIKQN
jgi:hypothetical protein